MLQTRERSIWTPSELVLNQPMPDPYGNGPVIVETPRKRLLFEIMTPNSTKGGNRRAVRFWKPFEHYKCVTVDQESGNPMKYEAALSRYGDPGDFSGSLFSSVEVPDISCHDVAPVFGEPGRPVEGLPVFVDESIGRTNIVPSLVGLDQLKALSLKRLLPVIKSELSLVNSIIELKDFLTLRGSIEKCLLTAKSFLSKGTKRQTLREILRSTSDGYLQVKFNFLPLISDIRGIIKSIKTCPARVERLLAQDGVASVSHMRYTFTEFPDSFEEGDATLNWHPVPSWLWSSTSFAMPTREVKYSDTVFHAQLQYIFTYESWQRKYAYALAALDSLGISLNPAIVWNAIPWSFVVDWLLNVGQTLSTFRSGSMDPKINILQYCWSYKRRRDIRIRVRLFQRTRDVDDPDYLISHPVYYKLPGTTETAYCRGVGLPDASSIELGGLDPTEFSLASALVLTRGKTRITRKRSLKFLRDEVARSRAELKRKRRRG